MRKLDAGALLHGARAYARRASLEHALMPAPVNPDTQPASTWRLVLGPSA
jgi:hypothetical protein